MSHWIIGYRGDKPRRLFPIPEGVDDPVLPRGRQLGGMACQNPIANGPETTVQVLAMT